MTSSPAKVWGEVPNAEITTFELPPIVPLKDFLVNVIEMPPVVIDGMIRKRSVIQIASGSKSFKTWTLLQMALCVSRGVQWLGRTVTRGRVLFVNLELTEAELHSRLSAIADALSIDADSSFDICNLRGRSADISDVIPAITKHCEGKDYSLIIVDPIYSMMGERNENAASDMADFLNHLTSLSEATEAAVVYAHHFAKGNASSKQQIDRASGSGVFQRHADGIITLTPHKEENALVVEAELRSFRRLKPFTIKWEYPTMDVTDLDPAEFKSKAGRPASHSVTDLIGCLAEGGLTTREWKDAANEECGIKASTFYELRKRAIADGLIEENEKKWVRIPTALCLNPVTGETKRRRVAPLASLIAASEQ